MSKEPNPSKPEPLVAEENNGRDVECIRVSSRSSTRVLGEGKGGFRALRSGVDDREAEAGEDSDECTSIAGCEGDAFGDGGRDSDFESDSSNGSGVSQRPGGWIGTEVGVDGF